MTKLISIMPTFYRLIARVVRFESGVDDLIGVDVVWIEKDTLLIDSLSATKTILRNAYEFIHYSVVRTYVQGCKKSQSMYSVSSAYFTRCPSDSLLSLSDV